MKIRNTVCGVGINDAQHQVTLYVNGRKVALPAYRAWKNMIERCYSKRSTLHRPTYIGVSVCVEWLTFSKFRDWFVANHICGYELDKDLIGSGFIYSPDSCIYIPGWLNRFTIDRKACRGDLPIGVYRVDRRNPFAAMCSNPKSKKRENLGYFSSPDIAHMAWKVRKLQIAQELRGEMDFIDERIYPKVVSIINSGV